MKKIIAIICSVGIICVLLLPVKKSSSYVIEFPSLSVKSVNELLSVVWGHSTDLNNMSVDSVLSYIDGVSLWFQHEYEIDDFYLDKTPFIELISKIKSGMFHVPYYRGKEIFYQELGFRTNVRVFTSYHQFNIWSNPSILYAPNKTQSGISSVSIMYLDTIDYLDDKIDNVENRNDISNFLSNTLYYRNFDTNNIDIQLNNRIVNACINKNNEIVFIYDELLVIIKIENEEIAFDWLKDFSLVMYGSYRPVVITDAIDILMHLARMHVLPVEPYDFSGNGEIDIEDAIIVLMGLARMIDMPMIAV